MLCDKITDGLPQYVLHSPKMKFLLPSWLKPVTMRASWPPLKRTMTADCTSLLKNHLPRSDAPLENIRIFAKNSVEYLEKLGEKLHEKRYIYGLFGGLDGLNLAFSMESFVFGLLPNHGPLNASDLMHNWMFSPAGIAITVVGTIGLSFFSALGNFFEEKDQRAAARFFAVYWPYVRDVLKATKNTWRGARNALQLVKMLDKSSIPLENFNAMSLGFGLVMGAFSASMRVAIRYMDAERKRLSKQNEKLLKEIKALKYNDYTLEKLSEIRAGIQTHSLEKRALRMSLAAVNGTVDTMYLQMGMLTLVSLAPGVMIGMTACVAVFSIALILGRIHEEYEEQRKMRASETRVLLALAGKEVALHFRELQSMMLDSATSEEELEAKRKAMLQAAQDFQTHQKTLESLTAPTLLGATMMGVRNGLSANSALSGIMFFVAAILMLSSTAFPPALLITWVSLCMASLIAFSVHGMISHLLQKPETPAEPCDMGTQNINDFLETLKAQEQTIQNLDPEAIEHALNDSQDYDDLPQSPLQDWFEVLRCLFSGAGKGEKFSDNILVRVQVSDDAGHWHDTPLMFAISAVFALISAPIFALRALANRIGKNVADRAKTSIIEEIEDYSDSPDRLATSPALGEDDDEQDDDTPEQTEENPENLSQTPPPAQALIHPQPLISHPVSTEIPVPKRSSSQSPVFSFFSPASPLPVRPSTATGITRTSDRVVDSDSDHCTSCADNTPETFDDALILPPAMPQGTPTTVYAASPGF
ncbi:transmembrane protein [Legionella geestiana]|uniref:Transmembrane protein n=1 Tax=Legionella geestiana TaxID=45065 RepID=A0A0W0U5K7_9GAMM|nr:transmembrane protein [Legionella geestiana]STX52945.1 transmembrane protein [Legionella geestiana]